MDYMKKMPAVLEAVGIHTKDVPNVFASSSDVAVAKPFTGSLTLKYQS